MRMNLSAGGSGMKPEESVDLILSSVINTISGIGTGSVSTVTKQSLVKKLEAAKQKLASQSVQKAKQLDQQEIHSIEEMDQWDLANKTLEKLHDQPGEVVYLNRKIIHRLCAFSAKIDVNKPGTSVSTETSVPLSADESRLDRIEAVLEKLSKENAELKKMMATHLGSAGQHCCYSGTEPSCHSLPSAHRTPKPTTSTEQDRTYANGASKAVHLAQNDQRRNKPGITEASIHPKRNQERVPTIRIKPKEDGSETDINKRKNK